MNGYTGLLYASATLTANGNSGWLNVASRLNLPSNTPIVIERAHLAVFPSGLATDETLDLDLEVAWTSSGGGGVKVHDFAQADSNNTTQYLILPGGESAGNLVVDAGTESFFPGLIPQFWRFVWELGGTTKSMNFSVQMAIFYERG
jgi:hypothetical protein